MKKLYAVILSIALFTTGYHLNAQQPDANLLLDLVKKNAAPLRLSPADADNAMISHSFTDSKTNITYVYLQQAYQQIKVYNSIMTIIFRNDELLYSSGKFVENLAEKAGAGAAVPALLADRAISNAATHLRLPAPAGLRTVENKMATEKKIIFSGSGIAKNTIETELCWVAADDGSWVKLAWNVNIDEARSADWWNVRVNAMTGDFLEKNNWTVHEGEAAETDAIEPVHNPIYFGQGMSSKMVPVIRSEKKEFSPFVPPTVTNAGYYVVKQPTESPNHGSFTLVTNPWLAAGAGNNATTHGWHFDGTTNYDITRGNNVHAYLDVANSNNPASAANTPLVSTTPDPSLTFNFVPVLTQQPGIVVNRQAAVTNLFYWNNTIHDILYQYGFNEASGNFQTDNLGRGGVVTALGDYVQAEAQDAGGTNNANFATPADGSRPRMQMYLWTGPVGFVVHSPAVIAGSYFARESGFSTNNRLINVGPVTGQVVWYNDDASANPSHFACNGTLPGSLAGKIAMIVRGGGCVGGFVEKVKNAQNNGAKAVIMVNNVPGSPITMGGTDNTIVIPAVMISDINGALLESQLGNNVNVTLSAGVGLDGDFDNGIITHEYGHGVSNRMTGGAPNSGCLGNQEQGGEGWSDYLGLMLTTNWASATLNSGSAPRPIGSFALGHPVGQGGIRTAPYSTNMIVSPQSYTNVGTMAVPHGIGEIWCSAIWDMTWNIIQQDGVINPNIYNANAPGGNSVALKLVMEGMRLQTCRPGFIDGRNAILAADSILYNGRYKCAIWAAFAKRGMGLSAVQGSSNSVTDGTAAFDIPSLVQLDKLATPLTVVLGEQVGVNLTATCQCQINTNYTIRDTIPAGFTYVSSTGGTLSGNVVTFSNVSFATPQQTKGFSIVLRPTVPGCAITTNIDDNRDGSTSGGLASVITTGTTNWVPTTVRSASPVSSWFAASSNTTRDFSLSSDAAGFTAGSLSVFSFKHFFITKNTLEGGRVEYSTNGGTTWLDAGPMIIQQGYNNTSSVATPWGIGQRMFGGVSYGRGSGQFISTIVDLSSLGGQNVRLRLRSRGTTTSVGTYEGWYVDDILQMDGCGGFVKAGLYDAAGVRVDSLASPVFIKTGTAVSITTQPVNRGVCVGATAVFSVQANMATAPTFQWQVSSDGGANFTDMPGQNSNTLTLTAVTLAMSGNQYRVVVASSISSGFVISNSATLTVIPIPTVIPVASQTVCSGTVTTVTLSGTGAGAVFNWANSNTAIGLPASGSGNISFTATNTGAAAISGTITVTPATTSGGGTCTGTPVTFTITVNPSPTITVTDLSALRICISDTLVPLVGSPVGGFWTGIGVSGFNFLPPATAIGAYTLTYSYSNSFACTRTGVTIAKVVDCVERERLLGDDALILYPNPNNGRFNIRINSSLYEYLGMKVYNGLGQLVNGTLIRDILTSPIFTGLQYGRVIPFDLSYLPSGIYFIKYYYDDGVRTAEKTFKVVIAH